MAGLRPHLERLNIQLGMNPRTSQGQSPASVMMLAQDFWHTDFAIGQDHSDVIVWLRRPGSDLNGNPTFDVHDALRLGHWNRIDVRVRGQGISIDVNHTHRLTARLPEHPLRNWSAASLRSAVKFMVVVPGRVRFGMHGFGHPEMRSTTYSPVRSLYPLTSCTFPTMSGRFLPWGEVSGMLRSFTSSASFRSAF